MLNSLRHTLKQVRVATSSLLLRLFMKKIVFRIFFMFRSLSFYQQHIMKEIPSPNIRTTMRVLYLVDSASIQRSTFKIASGNIHFEIIESYKERYKDSDLVLFPIPRDTDLHEVIPEIIDLIIKKDIRLVMGYPEAGPGRYWKWDLLIFQLRFLDVIFLGIMLDSVHLLHQFRINYLLFLSPKCKFIAIDQSPFAPKNVFGPVFLPISRKSLYKIRNELHSDSEIILFPGLNFSGKLYVDRDILFKKIKKRGIPLSVNSHLRLNTMLEDNYILYLKSLLKSEFNLYLSKNSLLDSVQLKTRALELSILGKHFLSDSPKYLEKYFEENLHFFVFSSVKDLHKVFHSLPNFPFRDDELASIGFDLALNNFWDLFESMKIE